MAAVIPLGARVQVTAGTGTVRFVGQTAFAAGKWVGIELEGPGGKNDGSVAGTRYFTCDEGYGVFVRASMVTVLDTDGAESAHEPPAVPVPRPASRTSSVATPSSSRPPSRPLSSVAGATRPRASLLPATTPSSGPPSLPASAPGTRPVSAASSHASSAASISAASRLRPLSPVKPRQSLLPPPRPPSVASQAPGERRTSMLPPPTPRSRPGLMPPTPRSGLARPSAPNTPSTARKAPAANFAPPAPNAAPPSPSPTATPRLTRPSGSTAPKTGSVPRAAGAAGLRPVGTTASSGAARTPGATTTGTTMRRTLSTSSSLSTSSVASSLASASSGLRRPLTSPAPGLTGTTSRPQSRPDPPSSRASSTHHSLASAPEDEDGRSEMSDVLGDDDMPDESGLGTVRARRAPASAASVLPGTSNDPFSLRNTEVRRPLEETVPQRLYDELAAKLSIVERRRAEDRDKLRDLDRLLEEQGEWHRSKEKTKAKVAELTGEVKELKRENKDLSAERDAVQSKFDDLQEQVEHSLLDKEIAESELEDVQAKLKELEEKLSEVQVELEVVKEENARLEGLGDAEIARMREGGQDADTPAASSLAFRQLEKQNIRLKDALLRLRDLTTENETEMKRKIENLEKEVDLSADLQGDLDNMAVELDAAEAKIEDLRSQLDIAAEAQEMLEELTERNMHLQDENEVLKEDVEELEALRELADELEESHTETEKQLQQELDLRELQLQELRRRTSLLEDNCVDYETTIGQFRELVISLQGDLEHLRQQHATQETHSRTLSSQSQAMLNLNLKLQSTVLKSQVKAIDLELRELEAKQAGEHLSILKPYLLPSFFESDADAVQALLFFERVAEKISLLGRFIEQKHNVGEALDGTVPDDLVAICEARSKLAHFAALNERFSANLRRCPADTFIRMGGVYREVASTEKRIDAYVEALRREELQEVACAKDLEGLVLQTEHLAESSLQSLDPLLDLLEREMACVSSLDLDLDTIAAAAGFAKQTVASTAQEPDIEIELGGGDLDDALFKPLQTIVNASRNAKVLVKKLHRRLEELKSDSSALSLDHAHGLETLAYNGTAISSALSKLAADTRHYCNEVRASKEVLQLTTLHGLAKEIAAVELGKQSMRPLDEINALLAQLVQDISTALATSMEADHVVKLSYTAPWIERVAALQAKAAIDVGAEKDVVRLTEELRNVSQEALNKEQAFQEGLVKIELMEKRLEAVKKQTEALAQLEAELAKSRKQERTYEEANEVLQRDLDAMEQELDKLKQSASSTDRSGAAAATGDSSTAYEGNMETSYLLERISTLRNAVKFLRSENAFLKSHDLLSDLDQLPSYDLPPTPPRSPEPTDSSGISGVAAASKAGLPWTAADASASPLAAESFAVRSKRLLREARLLSSTPRLVDLLHGQTTSADGSGIGPTVRARRRDPRSQLWAEKERTRRLERKVALLQEEASTPAWRAVGLPPATRA